MSGDRATASHDVRVPPQNVEAEQAVLGIVLMEGVSALPKIAGTLQVSDFLLGAHRIIYDTMLHMGAAGLPISLITLAERLRQQGQYDEIGGAAALALLEMRATVEIHLSSYVEIVCAHAIRRELIQEAERRIDEAYAAQTPASDLLDATRGRLEQLAQRTMVKEGLFRAYSIAELLALDLPSPTFHIDGWIPTKGLCFLVGDSEAAKSWLATYLALCIGAGLSVFSRLQVTQAPTLILSEENGVVEDRRRLDLLCRGMGFDVRTLPVYIASETNFSFDDPARYAALRAFCKAKGIRLAFIDSFIRVHRREEKDAGQMNALYMDRMKPLIADGTDLVLLHHKRKLPAGIHQAQAQAATTVDNDEIRGSGDLRAAAHAVLFLKTLTETAAIKTIVVRHNKARGFKKQAPFVFGVADVEQGIRLSWEGKPEDVLDKSGACREAVLAFAKDRPAGFYRSEVIEKFKAKDAAQRYSKKVIDPVLQALSDKGYPLKHDRHGKRDFYAYVEATPEPESGESDDVPF